ncbi:unnamed protein product [Lactuca saligna]|uniref:Uncharacterized protein n=1 Tax=Lactuca saligna TaxID=75948 RepID=A0AA36EA44_LACSI|nr:unnamed protein product [Lactuca saligna]
MENFQSLFESNIAKANEVISSLGSTLKMEKAKLKQAHSGLEKDNVELNSSISSKIMKLQDDLATMTVMKSCISDVNALLLDIIETCDSMIPITLKKHLSEKLRPVFTMLHRPKGVPESGSILKQRGKGVKQSKKEIPRPSVKPTFKPKSEAKRS